MTQFLKQSTSTVISFGPFVDETDGVTLQTGLVSALDHATTGIKISKNGGALAVRHATVTATTYDSYGNYLVTLDTTDTNTTGSLRVQFCDATTNAPVWRDFTVLSARAYAAQVEGATFNERGGRVWYVATTGSSGNPGSFDAPLDTIANAESAATSGDTVMVRNGTYPRFAPSKPGIEYIGESKTATILTDASTTSTLSIIGVHGLSFRRFKFVATHATAGTAVNIANNAQNTRIEDCWVVGTTFGVYAEGSIDLTVRGCILSATSNPLNAYESVGLVVESCEATTDCSHGTSTKCGAYRLGGVVGVLRNSVAMVTANNAATTTELMGLDMGVEALASGGMGAGLTIENVRIYVANLHASSTAAVYGIAPYSQSGQHWLTVGRFVSGSIETSAVNGGAIVNDVKASAAGSFVELGASVQTDAAKWAGASNIYTTADLSAVKTRVTTALPAVAPAANGGLPTVDALNQVAGVSGDVLGSVGAVSGDVEGNVVGDVEGNVQGSVGAVSGDVQGNVVGDVEGNVQGSVNSISGVTFPTNFGALAINASGHVSRVTLADTVTTLTEEVGGGSATDINIESIPTSRVFVLVPTASGLRCETRKQVIAGAPGPTYAVDFRNDAAANQKIFSVDIPSIVTGTPGGVTFGAAGREGTQAKFTITGVTAGDYVIRVTGRYGSSVGPAFRGDILVRVVE